jgi:mannosyl-3-phosphoglycerate phosphatase
MKILIFTDLDGSLLNHDDYSFDEALPAVSRIKNSGIPLIFTTSKTRREVELLQKDLGINEPFIIENGAAVYFPSRYRELLIDNTRDESPFHVIQLGISYDQIRDFIGDIRDQFNIRGFGDMSVQEVSDITGLPPKSAEFAKAREYTEPFVIGPEHDIHSLQGLAAERGIKITKGGRLHHMIGAHQDKGEAVKIVRGVFDQHHGKSHLSIGIGDSINDLPMLSNVDIPVIIPHPVRGYLDASLPGLVKAESPGCRGWNDIMERILDGLETNHT